jgi:very-short-patch-repair endonuclease
MSEDKKALFLHYWNILADGHPQPVSEHNFDALLGRKHRFDFAWPEKFVAVEINGNAWATRGGGRHGKDVDLEKMNLAVIMGWRVFQFSPTMLKKDPDRWIGMVLDLLNERI